MKAKEAAAAERESTERMMKAEREREVQAHRERQGRAGSSLYDAEAARAQRAEADMEQAARLRDRYLDEKRKKLVTELEQAREKQFQEREGRLQEQAKAERDEFLRLIEGQQ